jgi:copper chaperone CopZ
MKTTYKVTGMTCEACQYKVQSLLQKSMGVEAVEINLESNETVIESLNPINIEALKNALKEAPKYQIELPSANDSSLSIPETKSWFETYKPVLLIFFFVTTISLLAAWQTQHHFAMNWCRYFMAGFFFAFSFFKLLDVKGFAESYAMYDLIAKRIPFYGKVYPFIELSLGFLFLLNWQPLWVNLFTFLLMSVSLGGVLQSVLNKTKIRCACLGAVFNLPMSTVTIIEDGLMVAMAAWMILMELKLLV